MWHTLKKAVTEGSVTVTAAGFPWEKCTYESGVGSPPPHGGGGGFPGGSLEHGAAVHVSVGACRVSGDFLSVSKAPTCVDRSGLLA